ncbi:hypothetical protein Tco_0486697 [Tanacetum coccineum]
MWDESVMSTQEYIRKVVKDVGEDEDFKDIKNHLKNGKFDQVVEIIKSCTSNAFGDLTVTLKDLSGSALILANVSVFSPKPGTMHYLNITLRNVIEVFYKDIITGNGSGVCENVTDQEDQYKLDEEALNLALEEEERASRAEEEWLEKCRQEQELNEEHERQLLGLFKNNVLSLYLFLHIKYKGSPNTVQVSNLEMGVLNENAVCKSYPNTPFTQCTFGKHLEEKHVTWAQFGEKLDKNTTLQACDFHSDAFTKSSQKVKFLIKVVTSQVVGTALEITPDVLRIAWRRR